MAGVAPALACVALLSGLRVTVDAQCPQAGLDGALIAIWLGHESVETTQIYLDASLALKEEILGKSRPIQSRPGRCRPGDRLLNFLKGCKWWSDTKHH